jgi:hypothetical protein
MTKQTIGENAGKDWTVLNDNREMNLIYWPGRLNIL